MLHNVNENRFWTQVDHWLDCVSGKMFGAALFTASVCACVCVLSALVLKGGPDETEKKGKVTETQCLNVLHTEPAHFEPLLLIQVTSG